MTTQTGSPAPDHAANRRLLDGVRAAMYDFETDSVRTALDDAFSADAAVHLAHPFEDLDGAGGWFEQALVPLHRAMPDLERRDYIVMAGADPSGAAWIGCGGDYMGTLAAPFLDIPPTGRPVSMRFHEFFRVEGGRIVELQALWDIPELMDQAGVWPMGPSIGRVWRAPAPATGDGLVSGEWDPEHSEASRAHVIAMLGDMGRHPNEPVEAMRLDHWWHPRFSWYGPHGIGSSRGVDQFRRFHQIPFLAAMPDRIGGYKGDAHFFGDGDYVGVTAWPGMRMTMSGDGFLGIAPTGQAITMRSLDFWRVERTPNGLKIRENWVLVDLLDVWNQLGVDVLRRMREVGYGTRS